MSGIEEITRDPDLEWLDHVRPTGLVLSTTVIKERGLVPERQTQVDTAEVATFLNPEPDEPALPDPWAFFASVLGWSAEFVVGLPDGSPLPDDLTVSIPEHETALAPDWAVQGFDEDAPWQLLVQLLPAGMDPDRRGEKEGWEATPHQRFERLLRETGINVGVIVSDDQLRLVFAPKGETSGWLSFPLRAFAGVAGRPMLGGLKLLLDASRLFRARSEVRLRALLLESREAQAAVSGTLSEQVLGALHELLRGMNSAEPKMIGRLAREDPRHLYEGLLTTLMRLVFVLYAEDRDLIPSRTDGQARTLYEDGYSVRGLFGRLYEDAALNPDTMEERYGGWGRLLALFRLVHRGHASGFVNARGGKLFDPDAFPFLEGRETMADPLRVPKLSDGSLLRILEGLMTVRDQKTKVRQRLSYRTLDVEQIGSVYETVMGFTVEVAEGRVLAIRAGKNNRTPVYADLDQLVAHKPKERPKYLSEESKRAGTLGKTVDKPLREADTPDAIAAALDPIVDERASPAKQPMAAGTPILQPTEERRRTGSHYTPRSLTEPIVRHALEPTFERLGKAATPEKILAIKVCDPAMGSGAFLVEACRQLAQRLVDAWASHPRTRPVIPPDEDEELHARRLVAQRCIYGVDRNPMAVDLARLSLWLVTLARDHEFTFLDHALKAGDSLVGLSRKQIAAMHWDTTKPQMSLLASSVNQRVNEALDGRASIQDAPDDVTRAIQEARHRTVEQRLDQLRLYGNAVIAAFFSETKAKAREKVRQSAEDWALQRDGVPKLAALANSLQQGDFPVTPFHWEIEFPEVFARDNGGFDAVVGNPPFLGGARVSSEYGTRYFGWLVGRYEGCRHQCDLVAYFFRRSFELLRQNATLGLIATKSIAEGDTRTGSLEFICKNGGTITRAQRRTTWPGDAAVIVSTLHIGKGIDATTACLDGKKVDRVSAYLVSGNFDSAPKRLASNPYYSKGVQVYGQGFLFDDEDAKANPISTMEEILKHAPEEAKFIHKYIGGSELNSYSVIEPKRFAINLSQFNNEEDIPAINLLELVRRAVKPDRDKLPDNANNRPLKRRWWAYQAHRPVLAERLRNRIRILVHSQISSHHNFQFCDASFLFSQKVNIFDIDGGEYFAVLQSRLHEVWALFFGATLGNQFCYTTTDCYVNFTLPEGIELSEELRHIGDAYHDDRAGLMLTRNEGITKIYNCFHDESNNAPDIARLRKHHAEMDAAVLRAYGWEDLADQAHPEFIEQPTDEGKKPKTRLDWPSEFKDEVLARLLALNAERHREEVEAGLVAEDGTIIRADSALDEDEDDIDEEMEEA
ncbi:MAG: N-6 DNA methylase [Rhodospirillales bacterium]